ncbi:hypothetical protein CMUS01_12362 [Colletotrichum musicola]|uniref:Uncharacterized protein n=1 Tax=Colletotrichum musicola TaxID=2175873 RepID=A0A8H6N0I0_9PEZI|nr:hypothetical protein CMUS01_12362 [Colletotrichum musicola]
MSVVRVVEDTGFSDENAEELLKTLCIKGVPLDGQDPKCDDFVAGLDGSVAASLDASGIKIVNGSVFVTITETEPDPPSKLDLDELYFECLEAHDAFLEVCAEPTTARGGVDVREIKEGLKKKALKSFRDVENTINAACQNLQDSQKDKEEKRNEPTPKGRLRKALKSFRDEAPNIRSFLNVLPTGGEYTSILCGGLTILVEAIDQYGKVEALVCKALEEIQRALSTKKYAAETYRDDPGVHKRLSRVCAAIFNILGHILRWTNQSRFKRIVKPILKPATYQEKLGELYDILKLKSQDLLSYTERLFHERSQQADKKLAKQMKYFQKHGFNVATAKRLGPDPKPRAFNLDRVLAQLGYKNMQAILRADCAGILRRSRLDRDEQRKVKELTNDVRLQAFVEVGSSTVLLVQGGGPDKPRSAVSHVSASMVEALGQVCGPDKGIHVLAYFCGEHRSRQSSFSTPTELIIALILQLVDQCRELDPGVLAAAKIAKTCEDPDASIEDLCDLLDGLMNALPDDSIVFVILDGVSFFECRWRRDEMSVIVEFLLYQARERQHKSRGAQIKVLFTTPSRCLGLRELFEAYELYTLRKSSHATTESLLPNGSWGNSGLRDSIAALSDNEA